MTGLFIRWLMLTVAIMAAAYVLDGIEIAGFFSAFFAAAILGILNALLRPILLLITLPLNILTLGLFTFVINALMLMMASGVIAGFHVKGFWWAVVGSLIISAVSWLLTSLINDQGRMEVISLRRRHGRWE
jgi:putative membrane protein